jgi:hypothetical protein
MIRGAWKTGIAWTFVVLTAGMLLFPWFTNHKGSVRSELPNKLRGLILQYKADTGAFPVNIEQIAGHGNPDLSYRESYRCDIHPWKHRKVNTMEGGRLWIEEREPDGLLVYFFRPADWMGEGGMRVFVHMEDHVEGGSTQAP